MLVEINLLPRKEYKNRAIFIIIGLIVLILIIGAGYLYLQHQKLVATEERLTSQLDNLKQQRVISEQNKANGQNTDISNVIKLEQTVKWADDYFVETVPVLNHISGLLPNRGFVQSFSYVEGGIVSLVVQFDTNLEVAHYLAALNESPYISSTKLNSITTSSTVEESEQPPVQQEEVVEDTEDETGDKTGEEETEETAENKETTETVPETKEQSLTNSKYIPRYIAQFELTFDTEALKTLQREGE